MSWLLSSIVVLLILIAGVRIVTPVERLGKYRRLALPGFNWINPGEERSGDMKNRIRIGTLALCAATMSAGLAALDADVPTGTASGLCEACLDVCEVPLNHEDDVLDESTDLYIADALRAVATAAAIDMAIELRRIHSGHEAGYFGQAYETHAREIESLAGKRAESDHATSAEIRSLKRVRTALYADTVVGLRAIAPQRRSQDSVAAHQVSETVLDGVLSSLSSTQHMRAAERLAVCQVLAQVR